MRFIDLFAGIGGFHRALSDLGHECVFACEIDKELKSLYKENFNQEISGDISNINASAVPDHDILCAGFPCQPFSKAGLQLGLADQIRGTLFESIVKILRKRKPKYLILENVGNFDLNFYNAQDIPRIEKESIPSAVTDVRFTSDLSSVDPLSVDTMQSYDDLFAAVIPHF